MRLSLPALALALTSCASTTHVQTPPTQARQPPVECLKSPQIKPYRLPEWFEKATLDDQAALILNGQQIAMAAIKERDAKLADCRSWFK